MRIVSCMRVKHRCISSRSESSKGLSRLVISVLTEEHDALIEDPDANLILLAVLDELVEPVAVDVEPAVDIDPHAPVAVLAVFDLGGAVLDNLAYDQYKACEVLSCHHTSSALMSEPFGTVVVPPSGRRSNCSSPHAVLPRYLPTNDPVLRYPRSNVTLYF